MYDISQLNDMLVPELLDIAEQLNIPHARKLEKQDLIYKIVDRQAESASETKEPAGERVKRKRIVKTGTGNITEEAEVMSGERETAVEQILQKSSNAPKRGRKAKTK